MYVVLLKLLPYFLFRRPMFSSGIEVQPLIKSNSSNIDKMFTHAAKFTVPQQNSLDHISTAYRVETI